MRDGLVDTHAHLDFPDLHDQLDQVLERARAAGVSQIVTIGASRGLGSNERAFAIAQAHQDMVRCTVGIHPHDAAMVTPEVVETIATRWSAHPSVVGIGETGLDYHYDKAPRPQQQWAFREFIRLSKQVEKPVIIHTREAEEDTLKILEEEEVTGGILHCFTGTRAFAQAIGARDFYVSFSGIVTFKNGRELLEIARDVPFERLLVETDSPYLAPMPHRGKKNEPAFVRHTAEAIAQIRGVSLQALTAQTRANAQRVFGWEMTGGGAD